jgi:hemerythrin-like metal-binding protein
MAESVFFKWTERMSVGSVEIDQQHKKLVNMLNELYQAFIEKEHKEKIGSILDQLIDYTRVHFNTEEKYFTLFNYANKDKHIAEHQVFRKKVDEFIIKYKKNNGSLTYDVMNFLRNWLNNHIMDSDQQYIECFAKNGVI